MAYQLAIDYISGMTDRSFNDLAIRTGYMSYDDLDTKRGTTRSSSVVDLIAKIIKKMEKKDKKCQSFL